MGIGISCNTVKISNRAYDIVQHCDNIKQNFEHIVQHCDNITHFCEYIMQYCENIEQDPGNQILTQKRQPLMWLSFFMRKISIYKKIDREFPNLIPQNLLKIFRYNLRGPKKYLSFFRKKGAIPF